MPKVILSYPEKDSSTSNLKAGTSPILEVFVLSAYATAAGSSTPTLPLSDIDGFPNGGAIYIGINGEVSIQSGGGVKGAGNVTIDTSVSWSNNDAVVLKDVGGSDLYQPIYDSPSMDTEISQPFTADSNNQWAFWVSPGSYGIRYSDSDGDTLRLDADVSFKEESSNIAGLSQTTNSDNAGLKRAIDRGPSNVATVLVPGGNHFLTALLTTVSSHNVILQGSGPDSVVVLDDTDAAMQHTGGSIFYSDLTVKASAAVSVAMILFTSMDSTEMKLWGMRNVWVDSNGQSISEAIRISACEGGVFDNIAVGEDGAGANGFTTGVQVLNSHATRVTNVNYARSATTGSSVGVRFSTCTNFITGLHTFENADIGVEITGTSSDYVQLPSRFTGANTTKFIDNVTGGSGIGFFKQTVDGFNQSTTVLTSQSNVELTRSTGRFVAIRPGSVTGISVVSSSDRSAGTLTVDVFKNTSTHVSGTGATLGFTTTLDATDVNENQNVQGRGVDTFAAGDELYAVVTTTSDWAPTSNNIRVAIEVEE